MKRTVSAFLIVILLLCATPSQAASRFVFRDNITWGMSSEMVQFYEGYAEVKKDAEGLRNTFIRYKNQTVSKYEMDLEYYFMGNKLFAICYSKDFGEKVGKTYESLCKAYSSKYGDPVEKYASAISIYYCFLCYFDGEEIDQSVITFLEENIDKNKATTLFWFEDYFGTTNIDFWVLDDTLILMEERNNQILIMYIDSKTVTAENNTTGI